MSDEVYEGLSRRTGGTLSLAVLGGAGTGKSTFVHSLERAFGSEEGSGQAQAAGLMFRFSENGKGNAAVLLSSDGTVNGARSETVAQEETLAASLQGDGIPFVVVLNSDAPHSGECEELRKALQGKYGVPVLAYNCAEERDWGELWDSLWNNKDYALREEKRRLAANKINRAKIQPGIRIHVRQGYGSDARELGTVFNGVIAEVSPEARVVTIVAQGNGIELTSPIMDDIDGDEVQYQDSAANAGIGPASGGASPRTILTSFLTTRGGSLTTYINGKYDKDQTFFDVKDEPDVDSNWGALWESIKESFNDNPYGLKIFGDLDYKDTFPEGEIVQNIYEVANFPYMDASGMDVYTDKDMLGEIPYISFETRGKTIWDIMHICKSVAPDYITGIADFGFRNTIFFGKPHYYYAYDRPHISSEFF